MWVHCPFHGQREKCKPMYYSDMWSFTKKLSCLKLRISTLVLSNMFIVSILLIRKTKSSLNEIEYEKGKSFVPTRVKIWYFIRYFSMRLNHQKRKLKKKRLRRHQTELDRLEYHQDYKIWQTKRQQMIVSLLKVYKKIVKVDLTE